MKRKILKQILTKTYSTDSVKSILIGRMKPSYDVMFKLNQKYNIPFTAWSDIKSFITDDYINNNTSKTTTKSIKGVA